MRSRPSVILAAAALFAFVVPGCLCGKIKEKIGEKAAEKAIEALADDGKGGKAKVDLSKGKITITDDKGQTLNMAAGGDAKLPADWPADVPVLRGAKITFVMQAEGGANVSFETSEAPQKVYQYYESAFAAQGWKISVRSQAENTSMLMASKEPKRMTSVVITSKEDGKTTVVLTHSKKS